MKRFRIALLSLGLVIAFSAPAFAMNADFTGEYWAMGWFASNPSWVSDSSSTAHPSAAFVNQRFRLFTRFNVEKGLRFTLRSDIREDVWRPNECTGSSCSSVDGEPQVANDHTYVTFSTAIGTFQVGNQASLITFGTGFMNSSSSRAGIKYTNKFGPVDVGFAWQAEKNNGTYGSPYSSPQSDRDSDIYALNAAYKAKGMEAGLQYLFARDASRRTPTGGALLAIHAIEPYARAKFGPVDLEAEGFFVVSGDYRKQDASGQNVSAEGWGAYVNGKFNMGPAYVGARIQWQTGDDPATSDKREGNLAGTFGGGTSGDPCLVLFQGDYTDVFGDYRSPDGKHSISDTQDNMKLYQIYAGFSPTPKIDLTASYTMIKAFEKPTTTSISDDFGKEFDFQVAYKIFDKLSYMIDFGYVWTGDWFKGQNANEKIDDAYVLRNMIKLEF